MIESVKMLSKMKYIMAALFVLLLLAGFIWAPNKLSWTLGVLVGGVVGILMFIQLGRSAEMAMLMAPKSAARYFVLQYGLRIIVYAVTVLLTLRVEEVSTLATVAGLSVMKLSILSQNFYDMRKGGHS